MKSVLRKITVTLSHPSVWLIFCSLMLSCNSNKNSNVSNDEVAEEAILEESEVDADDSFEQGSDPVAIAGVNLTYESAKVVCDYTKEATNSKVFCRVVDTAPDGTTFLPVTKEKDLELEWLPPVILKGEASFSNCDSDELSFTYQCDVEPSLDPNPVELDFRLKLQKKDKDRLSTAKVTLALDVQFTAGFVPSMPFSYDNTRKSTSLSLNAEEGTVFGMVQKPVELAKLAFSPGMISSMCYRNNILFVAAGSSIYRVENGKYTTYAGIGRVGAPEQFEGRYRVHFGGLLILACHENGVFVADNVKNRILKLSDVGPVQLIAGVKAGNDFGYTEDGKKAAGNPILPVSALAIHPETKLLYFAETLNNAVRYIDPDGKLETIKGGEEIPFEAKIATFGDTAEELKELFKYSPLGKQGFGRLTTNLKVRGVEDYNAKTGFFMDFCSNGIERGGESEIGTFCKDKRDLSTDHSQELGRITSMVFQGSENLIIANSLAHILQNLNIKTKELRIIAGKPNDEGQSIDGTLAAEARISQPASVLLGDGGKIYFTSNTKFRFIDTQGKLGTIAGKAEVYKYIGSNLDKELIELFENSRYQQEIKDAPLLEADLSYLKNIVQLKENKFLLEDSTQLLEINLETSKVNSLNQMSLDNSNADCLVERLASQMPLEKIIDIKVVNHDLIYFIAGRFLYKLKKNPEDSQFYVERLTDCFLADENAEKTKIYEIIKADEKEIMYFEETLNRIDIPEGAAIPSAFKSGVMRMMTLDVTDSKKSSRVLDPVLKLGFKSGDREILYHPGMENIDQAFAFGISPVWDEEAKKVYVASNMWGILNLGGSVRIGFFVGEYDLQSKAKKTLEFLDFTDPKKAIVSRAGENRPHEFALETSRPSSIPIGKVGDQLIVGNAVFHQIYLLDSQGNKTVIAGDGTPGYSGDGGLAKDARISWPSKIRVLDDNTVFFLDYLAQAIRVLRRASEADPWKIYTVLTTESKNNCATSFSGNASGENLDDALSTSLGSICKGQVSTFDILGNCKENKTIQIYYGQFFEKKYGNIVSVEFDCL